MREKTYKDISRWIFNHEGLYKRYLIYLMKKFSLHGFLRIKMLNISEESSQNGLKECLARVL